MATAATQKALFQAQARLNRHVLSLVWPALTLYLAAVLSLFLMSSTPPAVTETVGSMAVASCLGLAFWWRLYFQPLLTSGTRHRAGAWL